MSARGLRSLLAASLQRFLLATTLVATAVLVAVAGVVALAMTLYFALAEYFQPAEAAFLSAGALFAVSFALLLGRHLYLLYRRPPPTAKLELDSLDAMLDQALLLGDGLRRWVRGNVRDAALTAFAVGLTSALGPAARQTIRDFVEALAPREPPPKP